MTTDLPVTTNAIPGHPALRLLVSFPIACFSGALATDIAYAATANIIWADFSDWLLAAGMGFGVLAAVVACVSALSMRRAVIRPRAWPWALGGLLVLALGAVNNLVHSRDAWTSVMPTGLALSTVTVLLIVVTIWLGSTMIERRPAVVIDRRPEAMPYPGVRS